MTTNYNKVKNEGMEEFDRTFVSNDPSFPLEKYWEQTDEGTLDLKKHKDFAFSLAEKVHKATLEDVAEKEEHNTIKFLEGFAHNSENCKWCQIERDYIKTLTK